MSLDRALNEILVEEGYVTRQELQDALVHRVNSHDSVVDALLRQGKISVAQKLKCVGLQTGIPFIDLKNIKIDSQAARLISQRLSDKLRAIIIEAHSDYVVVALQNALDLKAIDEIADETGRRVEPVWATESDITDKISEVFGAFTDLEQILNSNVQLDDSIEIEPDTDESENVINIEEQTDSSPVIQFVNGLVVRAIRLRASDIHIQPLSKTVKIKFRIDGVIRDIMEIPKEIHRAVVSRIKVISGLDIAERRIPQDGRASLITSEGEYDFRVATYPSVNGEKITIRVLDKQGGIKPIRHIGMDQSALQRLLWAVDQSQGLILITGPTGSGKTTTLYGLLNHVNQGDRQIITVEDPAEYQIDGIVQANVNRAAGMTFAAGLKAILRADPDVILVGESRDPETAKTSIEAALTGHLVLTSLHANDSAAALTRLIEMGIEEFLVSASVTCSVAQRLLRCNCKECSEPYSPNPELLEKLNLPANAEYKRGVGCPKCADTGYKGRMGIYEVMEMTNGIQKLLLSGAPAAEIRKFARQNGMLTMMDDAALKAQAGLTTVEEVARVIAAEDFES